MNATAGDSRLKVLDAYNVALAFELGVTYPQIDRSHGSAPKFLSACGGRIFLCPDLQGPQVFFLNGRQKTLVSRGTCLANLLQRGLLAKPACKCGWRRRLRRGYARVFACG